MHELSGTQRFKVNLCACGCGKSVLAARATDVRRGAVKGQPQRFVHGHGRTKEPNQFEQHSDGTTVLFLKYKGETMECLIWTRDYEKVKGYHWYADKSTVKSRQTFYARTDTRQSDAPTKTIRMHCLLVPDCAEVDHKNHNTLDNRVYDAATDTGNIRPATVAENRRNMRKPDGKSSQFKGVSWSKQNQKWRATITTNGKHIWLGSFESELEASFAYQEAAKKHFGEFACVGTTAEEAVKCES
jgi:hypothetical protein